MGRLKELVTGEVVHERNIQVRSYPLEDGSLLVEGILRDERFITGYHWDGRVRPPGVVHELCIRFLVGGWPLEILDAEAEMLQVPDEGCPEAEEAVRRLIGLPILSGYSQAVKRAMGETRGCLHLTHLALVMGTAALHGYWTQRSREPMALPDSWEEWPGIHALLDSCHLWTREGPMVSKLRQAIETRGR